MSSVITGNITRDPELTFVNTGQAVCKFAVAVTRLKKDEEIVSYFDCNAWGTLAENVHASLKKGDRVVVSGTFNQDRFEKDRVKREKITLTADSVGAELRFATVEISKAGKKTTPEEDF